MQGNKNWDNPNSKKNQFKKGDTSWAKGKTKENCEILKKGGEKISKTKKRLSKEGKLKSWCKGKTKKNNKSLKAISEKMKNGGALKARMANKGNPSKPELELKKLIKNHKIKLSHNSVKKGIWFRGKTQSFNPDFINKKEKKIVELFGRYWHNLPEKKKADKERLETYKKYGYSTLIIWDFEMKNKDNVLIKLRGFL